MRCTTWLGVVLVVGCGSDSGPSPADGTGGDTETATATGASEATSSIDPDGSTVGPDGSSDATGAPPPDLGADDGSSSDTGLVPEVCGDGLFEPGAPPHYAETIAAVAAPADLALVDLDADGDLDVVVSAGSQSDPAVNGLHVLLGDGQGGFAPPVALDGAGGPPALLRAVAIADADVDLIAVSWDPAVSSIRVWRGEGDGSFAAPVATVAGASADHIATGDVDGDGRPDLVGGGSVGFWFATATAAESFGPAYGPGVGPAAGVDLGDLDHDGDLDAVRSYGGGYSVVLGDGAGGWTDHTAYESPTLTLFGQVAIADFDGDHDPDVVVFENGEQSIRHGDGDAGFGDEQVLALLGVSGGIVGDFDLDGCDDIVGRSMTTLRLVSGRDDGTFSDPWTMASPTDYPGAATQAIGDVDGDGTPDLVVLGRDNGTTMGEVAVLRSGD